MQTREPRVKRPWFAFDAGDWLSPGAARKMTSEERGVYIDLLAYQWERGFIPAADIENPDMLARTSNMSLRRFKSVWSSIEGQFESDPSGNRFNPRLERERIKAETIENRQRDKGKKRWDSAETDDIRLNQTNSPNTIHNNTKQNNTGSAKPRFDLDAVYDLYPRKEGKADGMKAARKLITTQEQYDRLVTAVKTYAATKAGSDPKFLLLWSTFVNGRWEDYADGKQASLPLTQATAAYQSFPAIPADD